MPPARGVSPKGGMSPKASPLIAKAKGLTGLSSDNPRALFSCKKEKKIVK